MFITERSEPMSAPENASTLAVVVGGVLIHIQRPPDRGSLARAGAYGEKTLTVFCKRKRSYELPPVVVS